jgi:hypothetical protein
MSSVLSCAVSGNSPFDRFAVCEAHYLYLSEYHEGQTSDKYRRLSKLLGYFSPRPSLHGAEDLDLAGREAYARLVDAEGGVDLVVSIYGDGALLDASLDVDTGSLRIDEEPERDEAGNPIPDTQQATAILELSGVPSMVALRAVDYCRHENTGPEPYSDGYEAMECFADSKEKTVWSCDIPWTPEECDRLGGCYLCGGDHREGSARV